MENAQTENNAAGGQSRSTAGLGAWLPIATAPKDGTSILLWRDGAGTENIKEGRWRMDIFGREWVWGGSGWNYPPNNGPTFWMPKLEAPNVEHDRRTAALSPGVRVDGPVGPHTQEK